MEKDTLAPPTRMVCVIPFEDGWTVGFCGGHYAVPLTKKQALREAVRLAKKAGLTAFAIRDSQGRLEQWLPLDAPASPDEPQPAGPVCGMPFARTCGLVREGGCVIVSRVNAP